MPAALGEDAPEATAYPGAPVVRVYPLPELIIPGSLALDVPLAAPVLHAAGDISRAPLATARLYARAADIPPAGVGAYGVVAFQAKATTASHDRLVRVCEAFKAHFPRQRDLPAEIALGDQMLTIWPLDAPDDPKARSDDCEFVVDHYDLYGGQSAIADARLQGASLQGEGPFLIGWSPASSRGAQDKLVLVVDLSNLKTQGAIDAAFTFWRQKVIDDPALWRTGFSLARLRLSLAALVDDYGSVLLDAVKLFKIGGEK